MYGRMAVRGIGITQAFLECAGPSAAPHTQTYMHVAGEIIICCAALVRENNWQIYFASTHTGNLLLPILFYGMVVVHVPLSAARWIDHWYNSSPWRRRV